jgi:hypothetical protein
MSISSISGQASSTQINIVLSQGGAAGARQACHCGNDGDADDGPSSGGGSTDSSQGASQYLSLAQQIQSSVDSAVKNLDPSSASNPLDVLKTILQALDKALQDSVSGGSSAANPSQAASDAATGTDPITSGTSTSPGNILSAAADSSAAASNPSSLLDLLLGQSNVDANQFKNDLLSALNGSQNGSVDFSVVFQSFPVGQALNAQA